MAKKGGPLKPACVVIAFIAGYFVFGEATGATLSTTLFAAFGVADDEGLAVGEPALTGEPVGLGATLAVADGDGLATTGLGGSGLGS